MLLKVMGMRQEAIQFSICARSAAVCAAPAAARRNEGEQELAASLFQATRCGWSFGTQSRSGTKKRGRGRVSGRKVGELILELVHIVDVSRIRHVNKSGE
jgi:hypothetical protein